MNTNQRVLVTGSTGTLGAALVRELVAASHRVTANYWRDTPRAELLREETGCELWQGDVSDESTVMGLLEQPFDAVFHLAGINHDALLPRISKSLWSEHLAKNLLSAFLVTRASLQSLPKGGRVILVSSRVGEKGYPGQSAYGASKAALLGLMKSAAAEGKERGVRVNAVCPGFAPSAMSSELSPEILALRYAENWLPQADTRESFTAMCLYLLHARVSGQVFHCDCRI